MRSPARCSRLHPNVSSVDSTVGASGRSSPLSGEHLEGMPANHVAPRAGADAPARAAGPACPPEYDLYPAQLCLLLLLPSNELRLQPTPDGGRCEGSVQLDTLVAACADTSFEDGLRIDTELEPPGAPVGPVKPAVYRRRSIWGRGGSRSTSGSAWSVWWPTRG